MYERERDGRREVAITDIEALVPENHMVLLQHLFGIPSLRQTYQRACDTISYRWFPGYGLLDKLPHFATVSYLSSFPSLIHKEEGALLSLSPLL